PEFSSALSNLQQEALNPTGNASERGFEVLKDANGVISTNFVQGGFDGVKLGTGGDIIGGMHIHTASGNPMFSGQDIVQLRNTYHNGHVSNSGLYHEDVFSVLVVKDGAGTKTYAISISNYNLLLYLANTVDNNSGGIDLDKKLQNKYDNTINGENANAYMQDLLNFINGITPSVAINLFKLNNAGTAFETVTLDTGNNNPIATPCY
ncbi:MAG: hypothetical protein IMY67_07490, partial [Bacteroidetes bacterium]|nr:hypothetical protein [Bacteroidota bacterium]